MGKARAKKATKKTASRAAKTPRKKSALRQPDKSPSRTFRALVIDDNAELRKDLRKKFSQHGFRVFSADSVDSAMQAACRLAFDVIVVDVRMPESSGDVVRTDAGVTVVELLRRFGHKQRDSIVVTFTAFPNVKDCFACIESGAYYLPKTLPEESVAKELVEQCVRRVRERAASEGRVARIEPEETWRVKYHEELQKKFGGKTIAVVGLETARSLRLRGGTVVGKCKVFTADSAEELQKKIVTDPDFRKADPVLFNV